jgi:hypothetical protein
LKFVKPWFVLAETGIKRDFMPSCVIARIMFMLKRRFVPFSF